MQTVTNSRNFTMAIPRYFPDRPEIMPAANTLSPEEKKMWRKPRAYAHVLFGTKKVQGEEVKQGVVGKVISEKWPRNYIAECMEAKTKEARREVLANTPEKYREWVEKSVRNQFEIRAFKKARRRHVRY